MILSILLACMSGTEVESFQAVRGDLELRLKFKGELEAKDSSELVVPPLDGRPEIEWIVEDGTRVEAGDKVVQFDTEEMEKQLQTAKSNLDIANTKIEQHAARLALSMGGARQAVVVAELDQELAEMRQTDSETVPLVDREAGRVAYTKALMATESAGTKLERVQLDAQTELQLLELEAGKRERQMERVQEQIEKSTMVAPTAGLVVIGSNWEGKYEIGSHVWGGEVVVRLPDLSDMQVVAWVHEVDSPKVEVGQKATLTMDAHPGAPAEATIKKVADLAVERGENRIKHVRVVLEVAETTPKMKPGMTVAVDLEVERHPDVVQVPVAAIVDRGAQTVVWTQGLFGWSEVPVAILGRSGDRVAVEGIDAGTTVALGDPNP